MKAIILAAGRGSRMDKMTEDKPKCLVEYKGKPLLIWQTEALEEAGITEIGVVRGYNKHKVETKYGVYFDNENWSTTNSVMSLYTSDEWLSKYECVVSYSDIVYSSEAVKKTVNLESGIAIPYTTNWLKLWSMRFENPLADLEHFQIDAAGRLTKIGGRPNSLNEIMGQYMGILKIKPNGWEIMKSYIHKLTEQERNKIDMTSLLVKMLEGGEEIMTVETDCFWIEIDSSEDLMTYEKFNLSSK